MLRHFLATALAVGVLGAAPVALAADEAPVNFDQQVGLELQSWNWGDTQYTTPMRVFTVTDWTGALLGGLLSVAETETNRLGARREAIRQGERTYTYRVAEARRREGTRFGLTVGTGSVTGAKVTGTPATGAAPADGVATALMAKLSLAADMFSLYDGVFTFDSGIGYWRHTGPVGANGRASAFNFQAFDWPLGLTYRYAPSFVPGLVIEPGVNFNWLATLGNGLGGKGWNVDYRTFWLDAGYYVHPRLKLRAGYKFGHVMSDIRNTPDADLTNASAGITALF